MTKLKINGEYAKRHLFFVMIMIALGGWFGYDGFIKYPSTEAAVLYKTIEGSEPPAEMKAETLEAFKRQKIQTQYGFTFLTLLAALIVGGRLRKSYAFDFSFDENGYSHAGQTVTFDQVRTVDRSSWEKKGIIRVNGLQLDAWHHTGVKEFVKLLDEKRTEGQS